MNGKYVTKLSILLSRFEFYFSFIINFCNYLRVLITTRYEAKYLFGIQPTEFLSGRPPLFLIYRYYSSLILLRTLHIWSIEKLNGNRRPNRPDNRKMEKYRTFSPLKRVERKKFLQREFIIARAAFFLKRVRLQIPGGPVAIPTVLICLVIYSKWNVTAYLEVICVALKTSL